MLIIIALIAGTILGEGLVRLADFIEKKANR
jgi:hypothetical protein